MASIYTQRRYEVSAQVALTTTGDKMTFTPGAPVNIVRWGVIADALIDVGAGMTIKADFRPTAGSDTGRGDGDGGDITVTADIAQGKGAYTEEVATPAATAVAAKLQVDPGEQVVFQVTDAADTAGTGHIFVEYELEGFSGGSPAAALSLANRISNMTQNETF
jgi:hypothetical protein